MEGYDVVERLQIEDRAKRKAIKYTVIVDVIFLILTVMLLLIPGTNNNSVKDVIIIMIIVILIEISLITFALINLLKRQFIIEELSKRSKEYVETYLSDKKDVEVYPVDTKEYKDFMFKLTYQGQFYARMVSNDRVKIEFKHNKETEKILVETIHKESFRNYYNVDKE